MWKKQDDAGAQPETESPSKDRSDASKLLGDALNRATAEDDDFVNRSAPFSSKAADSNLPLPAPGMNTYTEAVKDFTNKATAFIEQLPLLAQARGAYEEAMRASAEMRKVLDTSDENLRALMTQLEEKINFQELKSTVNKKPSETAKVEKSKGIEGEGRAYRWP